MLDLINTDELDDNELSLSNENFEDSDQKNPNQNMLPGNVQSRSLYQSNMHSRMNDFSKRKQSTNMRGDSDQISKSQGMFQKDQETGLMHPVRSKNEYQSQKSGNWVYMKYHRSGSNSKANSYRNMKESDIINVKESNFRIKEMEDGSPKEDIIERENWKKEGVRTPNQFRSRPYSRRNSEMNFPRRSDSSLSRVKSGERDMINPKISSKKRYEVTQKIKENEEINYLRNKVNKLTMQLGSVRVSDSKLRIETEELRKKNSLLREHIKELKKSKDQLSIEKAKVSFLND
jgi:hypothetical protein